MSNRPSNKRKHDNAESIIDELPDLARSTLEAVAAATLRSSGKAVTAAKKVLKTKKVTKLHCLRCHEDFDPETAGYNSCTMEEHDENNGMIESGSSGMCWLYPCCLKDEDCDEPCWIGSHVTEYSEFSTEEKEHWCSTPDTENYWKDRQLALAHEDRLIISTPALAGASAPKDCIVCKVGQYCSTCCTCGECDEE
jgi:hypothetical protein